MHQLTHNVPHYKTRLNKCRYTLKNKLLTILHELTSLRSITIIPTSHNSEKFAKISPDVQKFKMAISDYFNKSGHNESAQLLAAYYIYTNRSAGDWAADRHL